MKNLIILISLLSVFLFSFNAPIVRNVKYSVDGFNSIGNGVFYSNNTRLKWSDYKKIPNKISKSNAVSVSYTGISYSYIHTASEVNIKVYSFLDKDQSYVVKGHDNEYILNHEQKHFDITYLFSLKLVKRLNLANDINPDICNKLYLQVCDEWGEFQDAYDKETRHSNEVDKQKYWDDLIRSKILELESELKIK